MRDGWCSRKVRPRIVGTGNLSRSGGRRRRNSRDAAYIRRASVSETAVRAILKQVSVDSTRPRNSPSDREALPMRELSRPLQLYFNLNSPAARRCCSRQFGLRPVEDTTYLRVSLKRFADFHHCVSSGNSAYLSMLAQVLNRIVGVAVFVGARRIAAILLEYFAHCELVLSPHIVRTDALVSAMLLTGLVLIAHFLRLARQAQLEFGNRTRVALLPPSPAAIRAAVRPFHELRR